MKVLKEGSTIVATPAMFDALYAAGLLAQNGTDTNGLGLSWPTFGDTIDGKGNVRCVLQLPKKGG
jgi:hypothetical protein